MQLTTLYFTKILEVNLFAFAYRLFHVSFSYFFLLAYHFIHYAYFEQTGIFAVSSICYKCTSGSCSVKK